MRKRLIRVSQINKKKELPFKASTFYKWKHAGKYPKIFVKIGGSLFVDVDEFERLCDESRLS